MARTNNRAALALLDEDEQRFLGPFLHGFPNQAGEWRAFCPKCENPETSKSPSASFNFNKNLWNCLANDHGRLPSINELVSQMRANEDPDSADVVGIDQGKVKAAVPSPAQIAEWSTALLNDEHRLEFFCNYRGLTRDTIAAFQLGWSAEWKRYSIPVFDVTGAVLCVKMYAPKPTSKQQKMIYWKKSTNSPPGRAALFNAGVLAENDTVVLPEGELDTVLLVQNGIPSVGHTSGAGSFQPRWAAEFAGKRVYIIPDDDEAGAKGALKTAGILYGVASAVFIVKLNTGIDKGDVKDWFLELGRTADELRDLMQRTPEWSPAGSDSQPVPTTGVPTPLVDTQSSALVGVPLEINVQIAGKQTPTYLAPKILHARCTKDKSPKVCDYCPMMKYDGDRVIEIRPDDRRLLNYAQVRRTESIKTDQQFIGARCSDRVEYEWDETWTLEDLYVSQSVEHIHDKQREQPLTRRLLNVGTHATGINETVRVVATNNLDPRDGHGILQGWNLDSVAVDWQRFKMKDELLDQLGAFQPADGQSPLDKCLEIGRDMANTVTGVRGEPREILHVAYDLVWHSVYAFNLFGRRVDKGWLEGIAVGDTRTGKSETALRLSKYYRAGLVQSCEGASFAGLVGGAQQLAGGNSWMITWGVLPLNDRRMVVLDEFSGISDKQIIEQMSSIRSSGVADIRKIAAGETMARTRLLWISNDPDGRAMKETSGIDSLQRLVKNPEDIARFDFAMALSSEEVSQSEINRLVVPGTPKYGQDACSNLIMWAWSREPDQIVWSKTAAQVLMDAANDMGSRYVDSPPLVQGANIRMKLARLAVAFAVRTFSTDEDGETVQVRAEHIKSAVTFLDTIYGNEAMGYGRISKRLIRGRKRSQGNEASALDLFRNNPSVLQTFRGLQVSGDRFKLKDIEELFSPDPDDRDGIPFARELMNSMIEKGLLRRERAGFVAMEAELVKILRVLEDEEE